MKRLFCGAILLLLVFFCTPVAGAAGPEVGPPSPKKPVSVQTTVSMVNFRQVTVSYSSSGQAHSEPVITGW